MRVLPNAKEEKGIMTQQHLTIKEMNENLNLAAEEIILQCMILNRRAIVQAHFHASPHVHLLDVRVMPTNTKWQRGLIKPDELGELHVYIGFDESDEDWMVNNTYSKSMAEMQDFIQYLDGLIEDGQPIITDVQGDAA